MPRKKPCDLCNFEETNVINVPFEFTGYPKNTLNGMPHVDVACSAVKENDAFKLVHKVGRNGVTISRKSFEIKYCPFCGRKLV